MKHLMSLALLVLLLCAGIASAAQTFGQGVTLVDVTKISTISKNMDAYIGKRVLVRGMVVDVCSSRGCWMDIASDEPFEKIQIKVDDGVMVFPMDARGKSALVEGIVEKIVMDYEEALEKAEHKAAEMGVKFDPSTVEKRDHVIYRIRGMGAVIE